MTAIEKEFRLIVLLLQKTAKYTKEDLANRLETSVRTIERYLQTLRDLGFVFDTTRGPIKLAEVSPLYKELSNLLYFSEEDTALLYNAIDVIETDTVAKQELKKKLASLYSTSTIKEKIIKLNRSKKVQQLMKAMDMRVRVVLKNYSSPSSRSVQDRLVEPFELTGDNKQVWCYEVESGKNKIFNLNRAESIELTTDVWQCSRSHQAGFVDAFRNISFSGKTMHVVLKLNQMAYSIMIDEYPLTERDITQTGPSEWTYEAEVSSYRGIGRFVLGLADCIEVCTPSLLEYMRNFVNLNL